MKFTFLFTLNFTTFLITLNIQILFNIQFSRFSTLRFGSFLR